MNTYVFAGLFALSLGANAYQVYRIDNYKTYSDLLDQKDRLTQGGYNELLYSHINSLKNDQFESAKSQGKIEGILSIVNNTKPEENDISAIWHSGYYRGMEQVDYVRTSSYEDGYHKACEDVNCPDKLKRTPDSKKPLINNSIADPKDSIAESKDEKPTIQFKPLPDKKQQ